MAQSIGQTRLNADRDTWGNSKFNYTDGITIDDIEANIGTKAAIDAYQPIKPGTAHMMGSWIYEPHRQNHFELQICGLEGMEVMDSQYRASGDKKAVTTSNYTSTYLTLSLNNFTMPDLKVGKITVAYGNAKVFYAGVPDYSDFSISFNDFVGLSTESILCAWFNQVYDPVTEKLNYSSKYKKDAYLMEYNVDGGFGGCWKIEGLWINNFKPGQYGQDNGNNVRKLDCTFTYDRIYPYKLLTNNLIDESGNAVES